jgi:hypothetical protein
MRTNRWSGVKRLACRFFEREHGEIPILAITAE